MEGVDYSEVFWDSKNSTVRLIMAITAKEGWPRVSLDIKTVFLNVPVEHKLYVRQPEILEILEKKREVYFLPKEHYGWRRASRRKHQNFPGFLLSLLPICIQIRLCTPKPMVKRP